MGVFTFVCRESGKKWSAKQRNGDLEGAADSTYELQRKLVQAVLGVDSSGGVSSSFSYVTPCSAVFQVVIGGGAIIAGGGAVAAAASAGSAPAAEAPAAEEKKEEKEESDDDDLGFSLFD